MINSVISSLEKTIQKFPNKIAVKDNFTEITFSQLGNKAKVLAFQILRHNVRNSPVCVFLPKSVNAIVSFAAINYSGNFYVPLDTKSPFSRVLSIINTVGAPIIITDRFNYDKLTNISGVQILIIDEIDYSVSFDENRLNSAISNVIDTDPVYSIFTSGSTGLPKGVVIPHRGVLDYIEWAISTFSFDSNLIIGNQAPFYFDNSTLDIYLMYFTGSTLVIIPEEYYSFPAKLISYINEENINFVFWVPFVLVNIANMDILSQLSLTTLKDIFFAGEVMPTMHLNYWRKKIPNARYVNLYGPTEITVDCTYYIVEREFEDKDSLPIGFPCKNTDVIVLTNDNKVANTNEIGELCVRGSSLALGYYNDFEKTIKAFIQNPLNNHYPELIYKTGDLVFVNTLGEIIFVGRKDSQIKHNGYRIELGEIENAVLSTGLVKNVCAVYDFNKKAIILFYLNEEIVSPQNFRRSLQELLPKYMVPSKFIQESKFHINANGKIDRLYYKNLVNE